MKTLNLILVILGGMALGRGQVHAATMRCDKGPIGEGETSFEVLEN
ncbi:hypothetical protein [Pseudomonas agarici]|nr:hypothetical protein [Pseudomonas agarici]NWB90251.1 hypothetical protein [Pseudomonas agarici]NWC08831.1 hypothetical protein [Pseudomonas agarici]SEK59019.1 hypothetical protein SAMN05216604_104164 [Pseudomonas agarici]